MTHSSLYSSERMKFVRFWGKIGARPFYRTSTNLRYWGVYTSPTSSHLISSHLSTSHLISIEVNWTADRVQFRPVQFTWDEMRWDEMRWDEMRWDEMRWDEMRWDELVWFELPEINSQQQCSRICILRFFEISKNMTFYVFLKWRIKKS